MATVDECKDIIARYKENRKRFVHTMFKIMVVVASLIILITMGAFLAFGTNIRPFFLMALTILIPLLIGLILITVFYRSEKPLYEYIYKNYIKSYNYRNSVNIDVTPYPFKQEKMFEESYLFPRQAFMKNRILLNYKEQDTMIFDTTIYLRSGQHKTKVFDGIYIIKKRQSASYYQFRSKGKPVQKIVKYDEEHSVGALNLFIEKETEQTENIKDLYQYVSKSTKELNTKYMYVSQTKDTIHIAYTPMNLKRRYKEISCPDIDKQEQAIKNMLVFIEQLK
ncbi:hypothetical protein [Liberiplasma polymorphum]|uniref:hypothetical protein n=1 Tax=Liberiplasma polymorphum TaxID=3374570 RepID=UPI003776ACA9